MTTFDIELDGKSLTLTHSGQAALAISDAFDGLAPAMAAISRLNVGVMAVVINAGAGLKGEEARGTAKAVAASNLVELSGKLTEYVAALCNGGRPFKGV
ncbi:MULTISPECIES: hypothetical protein [unclassified Mesorhizobium]|uniref:hypothetical protein n=1 Tax=unclassified Mesorhizobium TaxID=325217 RepID=UPI000FCC43AB|nr:MULTISPECIES: hypothetical protein [unclassified Mesorhizobium]RVD54541.1 hypothetical protein EN783_30390 [Mesorhizobium sp. M2D.F.Ca.ET.140.01.1.1]TGP69394.1 hypothetical protein EN867_30970 [Mesorhizobium sp. M2D.F.Ca.ET.224.01.1.1]TGP86614.1 hypothetical protein EN865_30965 [bacterium M00.F.Ca.ET.222.01.1.1]